jgi:aminoglycoside phosphotransferase (APT) family kinase protein
VINPAEMPARLENFLAHRLPEVGKLVVRDYQPMTGGYSRLMARFTAELDGATHRFVLRGDPPPGHGLMATDRDVEWRLLSALTAAGEVPMPRALHYDGLGVELGTKAIVLEMIESNSLLAELQTAPEEAQRRFALAAAELAAAIHGVPLEVVPECIARPESWDRYVDDSIAEWRRTEAAHGESDPIFRHVATWLERNRPAPAPLRLVHGELQTSNIIVDRSGVLRAVDWEMARIGDPREDLGWLRWMGRLSPPRIVDLDVEAFCRRYAQHSGLDRDLVDPAALSYFAILPMGRALRGPLEQLELVASGASTAVAPAYFAGVLTVFHVLWLDATRSHEVNA